MKTNLKIDKYAGPGRFNRLAQLGIEKDASPIAPNSGALLRRGQPSPEGVPRSHQASSQSFSYFYRPEPAAPDEVRRYRPPIELITSLWLNETSLSVTRRHPDQTWNLVPGAGPLVCRDDCSRVKESMQPINFSAAKGNNVDPLEGDHASGHPGSCPIASQNDDLVFPFNEIISFEKLDLFCLIKGLKEGCHLLWAATRSGIREKVWGTWHQPVHIICKHVQQRRNIVPGESRVCLFNCGQVLMFHS